MWRVCFLLSLFCFCGCVKLDKLNEDIDRSSMLITKNSEAVEQSTQAILSNAAAIQGSTTALGALTGFLPLPAMGLILFALLLLPSLLLVVFVCRFERKFNTHQRK